MFLCCECRLKLWNNTIHVISMKYLCHHKLYKKNNFLMVTLLIVRSHYKLVTFHNYNVHFSLLIQMGILIDLENEGKKIVY